VCDSAHVERIWKSARHWGGAAVKRRRNFRRTELGVPALATGSRAARTRADPSRPVAILVGFASGGARKPE